MTHLFLRHSLVKLCFLTCLGMVANAWPSLVHGQNMVSIQGKVVNMRAGPSVQSEILWELKQGYPLRVLQQKGQWLRVVDFENDTGWVARSLTNRTPHHVVKSKFAHVRSGPGTQHAIIGKAYYGEVVRTLERKARWVKVERSEGKSGWISKGLLWGW